MAHCRGTITDPFVPCHPQHRSESVKGGCVADHSLPAIESSRAQFEHLKSIARPWPLARACACGASAAPSQRSSTCSTSQQDWN